jgi:microcystin-dependent protein
MPQLQIPDVPTYTTNGIKRFIVPVAPGKLPFENEDVNNLQDTPMMAMRELLASVGTYFVINGAVVTAHDSATSTCTLSPGYVFLGGHIRFFPGYTGTYPCFIVADSDVRTQKTFEDGNVQDVYVQRFAKMALTPGAGQAIRCAPDAEYRYQDMIIARSTAAITALQDEVKVPIGGIIMWSNTTIPTGWALCDGQNNRPDLRGRFVVGYDPASIDYSQPGLTGGEARHTLTIDELPSHTHNANFRITDSGAEKPYVAARNSAVGADGSQITTKAAGGGQSHENRPPYYTLCYIMRVS